MSFSSKGSNASGAEELRMNKFAEKLKLTHSLSNIDQSVSRKYVRRMFIFDFPVVNPETTQQATSAIRHGLEIALKHYPFLTGMVGPAGLATRDCVTLQYGATEELRQLRDEIFKVKIHKENAVYEHTYEELCRVGMPTGTLNAEDYCATSTEWKLPRWIPAFALQANFLEDGALILCFEFQHSIADGTSVGLFLDVFAAGIRQSRNAMRATTYCRAFAIYYLFHKSALQFHLLIYRS